MQQQSRVWTWEEQEEIVHKLLGEEGLSTAQECKGNCTTELSSPEETSALAFASLGVFKCCQGPGQGLHRFGQSSGSPGGPDLLSTRRLQGELWTAEDVTATEAVAQEHCLVQQALVSSCRGEVPTNDLAQHQ